MKSKHLSDHVAANLRTCQLKQLSILQEIDRICKKHDIDYWLDGGTMLGAVRHGGFIPWDDDIDIAMMKGDMERFIQVAPDELGEDLFLQTPENTPSCKEPIVKVRNLNSLYIEAGDDFQADYPKGMYVDIFPFIDYPSAPKSWVKTITKGVCTSCSILHTKHYYSLRSSVELVYFGLKYASLRSLWWLLCTFCKKGTYLSNILVNNGYGIMHRKDTIFPLGDVLFEGIKFKAPANKDAYLTDLYGDYMQIPPEDKRVIHAIYINPELNSPTHLSFDATKH